jgi:hypothetical protein
LDNGYGRRKQKRERRQVISGKAADRAVAISVGVFLDSVGVTK